MLWEGDRKEGGEGGGGRGKLSVEEQEGDPDEITGWID